MTSGLTIASFELTKVKSRFSSKVEKTAKCWLWVGAKDGDGYGMLKLRGKNVKAHRLAVVLGGVALRSSYDHVLHKCDTPSCVRVSHLWVGDHAANMRDAFRKGRMTRHRGERHGRARLTESQVRLIRKLWAQGGVTRSVLAETFGVKPGCVGNITHRRTWKHLK